MGAPEPLGEILAPCRPGLTYEEMWHELKRYTGALAMVPRCPQQVFNVRDFMAELEAARTQPMRDYIHARRIEDGQ